MKALKKYLIDNIEMHKPHYIEAFSHVYGNEYHDFIKERINNTKILVCHDYVDYVQLLQIQHRIKMHDTINKQEGLDAIESALKLKKLEDQFDKYIYRELKNMFPSLVETRFPRSFESAFDSFSKRLGKNKWTNRSIIYDRIRYFNLLGINLGEDYSLYETNPECKKLIPNKRMKEKFKELMNELYRKENQLKAMFESNHKEIQEILMNNNYDRVNVSHKDMNGRNISYCMPNSKDGEIAPLCMFNLQTLIDGSENTFVHEFAHSIGISNLNKSTVYCDGKYKMLNFARFVYKV